MITPHRWITVKFFAWAFCWRCGLVRLRNEATEKAIRKGCHPDE